MSQEQKNRVEQVEGDVAATPLPSAAADVSAAAETEKVQGEQASTSTTAAPARKRKRKTRLVNAEEISPRPSYWPIVLAFSLAIVLFGIIAGPVFVVVGVLLALVSVGGWVMERR